MPKKKSTRSKKTIARVDHAIGIRVSPAELIAIQEDTKRIAAASGMEVKIGTYAKHAVLSHAEARRKLDAIRAYATDIDDRGDVAWSGAAISDRIRHILAGGS